MQQSPPDNGIEVLIKEAILLGAGDAAVLNCSEIIVEENLAALCREGTPPCENYGLSPGCPPHVSGPSGFRDLLKNSSAAILIRIDAPVDVMFSSERREVMQLLHEIVAAIETRAAETGFPGSKAFAGGSCKKIFCHDHPDCRVLSGGGECRNPSRARPSMSGFGINVARLIESAGWPLKMGPPESRPDSEPMTWVAGLVLLSRP